MTQILFFGEKYKFDLPYIKSMFDCLKTVYENCIHATLCCMYMHDLVHKILKY